jgi:membrane-bound lytic murein transglycosylase B
MRMVPFRVSRRVLLAAPLLAVPLGGGAAAAEGGFADFLAGLRRDASALGVRSGTIDAAFRAIQYLPHVVELDHQQPEHKLTFAEYFAKVVTRQRLDAARQHLADNWTLLQRVRQAYDVQPRFIVALWGVESDFGRIIGDYPVPAALATLAYDGRRGTMFRSELIAALKILDEGDIGIDGMRGSWAGAMGQCQFMPSTFLHYAVDFDGDGRRDIWSDRADVFASIANYLARLGWRGDEDWGREVSLPQNFDARYANLDYRLSTRQWSQLGVRPADGAPFSGREPAASLVLPDAFGATGFLVYDNFRAIKRWNNSTYFATAVGTIADSIDRS